MWTETQIIQTMMNYLQTEVAYQKPEITLTAETRLMESGILDSLNIFKLILFMEEQFSFKIQAEEIVIENFETLNTLKTLVQRKLHNGESV